MLFGTIITLIIALLSLVALMAIHEFGHFIIAKKFGVRVEEFGIGYPPRIFGKKIGETVYSLNWLPLGAFVKIYGEEGGVDDLRSFANLAIWKRVLIVIGGVVAFWIVAMILFSIVFAIGAQIPVNDEVNVPAMVKLFSVAPGSPADKAGLKAGDTILQVQSAKYESAKAEPEIVLINKVKDLQDFAKAHAGEQIDIKLQRGGKIYDVLLSPRVNAPAGEGSMGVGLERMTILAEKTPWYQAPVKGIQYTGKITWDSLVGLYKMFAGMFKGSGMPAGASFAGPIGITVFLASAAGYGVGFFLYFIASISVFVAIFNLFPIPALDGGKLVFLIIEKLRGRPVSVKVEQNITVAFFIILITLSLFITFRFDIPRLFDFFKASASSK